jgi:hypothetical protein
MNMEIIKTKDKSKKTKVVLKLLGELGDRLKSQNQLNAKRTKR